MSRITRRHTKLLLAAGAILPLLLGPTLATAATAATAATGSGAASANRETRPYEPSADGVGADIPAPKSNAASHVPASHVPRTNGLPVTGATGVTASAEGLSLRDQRTANGGNSFSLEPPDQGLCTGDGTVIEGVNNVFATYTIGGTQTSAPQSYVPSGTTAPRRSTGPRAPMGRSSPTPSATSTRLCTGSS